MKIEPCPFCGQIPEFQHSYHEDNHRYPRDFWHVRISCCFIKMDWLKYGQQEEEISDSSARVKAEAELTREWNQRSK